MLPVFRIFPKMSFRGINLFLKSFFWKWEFKKTAVNRLLTLKSSQKINFALFNFKSYKNNVALVFWFLAQEPIYGRFVVFTKKQLTDMLNQDQDMLNQDQDMLNQDQDL